MMTTRGRGRPKDEAKAEAILDAGWSLFLERGVGAVSIESIAARAAVSKMTVYKHFSDKHALFEQAVLREMRRIKTVQVSAAGDAVNDIESLSADLSRKIWQKLTILDMSLTLTAKAAVPA